MKTRKKKDAATSTSAVQGAAAEAGTKAPPAQEGDPKSEVKVAMAEPVLLPSVDQAKAELDVHPERTSVLSKDGHVVREPK